MLKECATLNETIGGKIKSSKSGFFAWIWVLKNGIKVLKILKKDMTIREERMKQYDNEQSARNLSICMWPALNWDIQFQEVNIKMEESIGKLSNVLITV